jgi:hypothetical protein
MKGGYGTEGAREKLIQRLQTWARINAPEIVNIIPDIIYGSDEYEAVLPNGYEKMIETINPFE